jgi:putative ABC transport system substrate-binding protein
VTSVLSRRRGWHRWLTPLTFSVLPVLAWPAEIVILKSSNPSSWQPVLQVLRQGAAGHTLTEFDLAGMKPEAERVLRAIKGRPAVIVALGPLAAEMTRAIAPEHPLVFAMVADPAKAGLLEARNTTGVAFSIPVRNQLAAYRMVNPRAVRIGIIFKPENSAAHVEEAKGAARLVRAVVVERPVSSERDVPQALRELIRGSDAVDALWIPPDPVLLGEGARRHILSETLKAKVPVYSYSRALVLEGALVSNGPDMKSIGAQLSALIGRVVGGEAADSISMAVPQGELVINKKIADRLGIEIPADALRVATVVN